MPEAEKTLTGTELLDLLKTERSTWIDVQHYPSTVTLRRMIRLADFAAGNPTRWRVMRLAHECPELSYEEMGVILGMTKSTVCKHLAPVDLSDPDDYPVQID